MLSLEFSPRKKNQQWKTYNRSPGRSTTRSYLQFLLPGPLMELICPKYARMDMASFSASASATYHTLIPAKHWTAVINPSGSIQNEDTAWAVSVVSHSSSSRGSCFWNPPRNLAWSHALRSVAKVLVEETSINDTLELHNYARKSWWVFSDSTITRDVETQNSGLFITFLDFRCQVL